MLCRCLEQTKNFSAEWQKRKSLQQPVFPVGHSSKIDRSQPWSDENGCIQGDMAVDKECAIVDLTLPSLTNKKACSLLSCLCDTHLLRSVFKLCKLGRLDKPWVRCGRLGFNNLVHLLWRLTDYSKWTKKIPTAHAKGLQQPVFPGGHPSKY